MVLAEMAFENTLINVMGACFFTFLGMCLAAQRYYAMPVQSAVTYADAHQMCGLRVQATADD
jgi:hypothetical protein